MDRRDFLKAASVVTLTSGGILLPEISRASRFDEVRSLSLIRSATGERSEFIYWRDGGFLKSGLNKANHLMRDVRANKSTRMSTQLLDVLAWAQAWLSLNGIDRPILINSGYRTKWTNSHTEGSVKNSYHTQGLAADIRIDGLPTSYLGELIKRLQQGGVGIYENRNFVHVDVGGIRAWKVR